MEWGRRAAITGTDWAPEVVKTSGVRITPSSLLTIEEICHVQQKSKCMSLKQYMTRMKKKIYWEIQIMKKNKNKMLGMNNSI